MRTRNDAPCGRECPDRSPACHSTCERYAKFAEQQRAINEARRNNSVWTRAKAVSYKMKLDRIKKFESGYFK